MDDPYRYDTRLFFDPVNGTLRTYTDKSGASSSDALTAVSIAEDGFSGPRFDFRPDNGAHQGGWHIHLYERNRGGYALTDVCLTRIGEEIVAYQHCEGKSTISLPELSRKAIKRLRGDGLVRILEKDREWTNEIDEDKVIARFSL